MLILRKFTPVDAEAYLQIANDPNEKFYPFSYCENIEDALEIIEAYNESEIYGFAIERKADKHIVGAIYLEEKRNGFVNVGYFIGSDYRRRGYAKLALFEIEKIAKSMGKKTIELFIKPNNEASISVAKSFGAKRICITSLGSECWQKKIK